MPNPFSISFGKSPIEYIDRIKFTNQIMEDFTGEFSPNNVYMITGIRGSGKTVLMTNLSKKFAEKEEWIVIELNPLRDMLSQMAASLYEIPAMHKLFMKAKLDLSALGLGASIENAPPVTDIENGIHKMLEQVSRAGKRILITVDEVTSSDNIKIFVSAFQIMLRKDYPVYLLMTGLYNNINNLQNDKSLTFLYRAPKIYLDPLSTFAMSNKYQKALNIEKEKADYMAKATKGYSFAFQTLGYLAYNEGKNFDLDDIWPLFDQYLAEYSYDKIWSELSEKDSTIIQAIAELEKEQGTSSVKVGDIREHIDMASNIFSTYKERLVNKGIIRASKRGEVELLLPRFEQYLENRL